MAPLISLPDVADDGDLTFVCDIFTWTSGWVNLSDDFKYQMEEALKTENTLGCAFQDTFDCRKDDVKSNYEELSDFTIHCGNDLSKSLKAHKMILSLRSSVFK